MITKKKIKKIIKNGTGEEITKALLSYIPVFMSKREKKFSQPPVVYTEGQQMFVG